MIGHEDVERIVEGLLPPPAVHALREQAARENRPLKEVVKDALYRQASEAIVERERLNGNLPFHDSAATRRLG